MNNLLNVNNNTNVKRSKRQRRRQRRRQRLQNAANNLPVVASINVDAVNKEVQSTARQLLRNIIPENILTKYTPETIDLLNLIANPIHCDKPARFTDNFIGESVTMYDSINQYVNINIQVTNDAEVLVGTNKFLFVLIYGPSDIAYQQPYQLLVMPINPNTDKPFVNNNDVVSGIAGANVETIIDSSDTALCDEIRMVAMGMRLNPLIEVNTGAVTQFVHRYYGGQMRHNDLARLVNPDADYTNVTVDSLVLQRPKAEYANMDGCSTRYNPFQIEAQTEFWDWRVITYDSDQPDKNAPFNIDKITFPYTYVVMADSIDPTVSGHTYTYEIPIKVECKFWLETILTLPTPIIMTPSPMDINFGSLAYTINGIPLTSDGHSFKNAFKLVKKIATPANVASAGKYVGGMIRSGRAAINDINRAWKGN